MIRKVVYFSMQVPNRPGVGVEMLRSIAKGKQNLLAFTGFPNGAKAQVDFVPAKPVEFARGAKKMGAKNRQEENRVPGAGRGSCRRAGSYPRKTRQGEDQHGRYGRGDRGQPSFRRNFLGEAQGHRANVATAWREIAGRERFSAGGCWSARPTGARRDLRRAARR